jgi:hypothetical protein
MRSFWFYKRSSFAKRNVMYLSEKEAAYSEINAKHLNTPCNMYVE